MPRASQNRACRSFRTAVASKKSPAEDTDGLFGQRTAHRVLTNSEAFRDVHANSQSDTIDPGCSPLDAPTTEGLFAALYFLSEQAERLSQPPLPQLARLQPGDVPY